MNEQLLRKVREIDQVHRQYLDQARGLTHEQFNRKPTPDQWSLAQVFFHLWNAANFTQTFMEKRIAENKVTQPTGWKNALKTILLQIALASPLKFKAPRAVSEIPAEMSFGELDTNFQRTAENFEKLIAQLPRELEDKEIFKHPRTGYINADQTLTFLKAHALHHRPQIENLLKAV